jgi:ABC-2 type transport system permease protein
MTDAPMNQPSAPAQPPASLLNRDVKTGAAFPVWAVFRRELSLYFRSPIAYAVGFAVLFFLGVLFTSYVVQANGQFPADAGYAPALLTFLTFLIAPLLTMRLISEEAREGTLEVLMTLPMNESAFIVGKFLAAWAYYTVLLLLTLVYVVILAQIGVPDYGTAVGAYVGAWLYGGAAIAIALIWSAVTEDQVVAAFLGAATILVLYLADAAASLLSGSPFLAEVVRELGFRAHFDATLSRGIVRLEDVLFFVFVIIGALFITTRIVEIRRWRA